MKPAYDEHPSDDQRRDEPVCNDTFLTGETILDRARAVGERIVRRCRQVAGDLTPIGDENGDSNG